MKTFTNKNLIDALTKIKKKMGPMRKTDKNFENFQAYKNIILEEISKRGPYSLKCSGGNCESFVELTVWNKVSWLKNERYLSLKCCECEKHEANQIEAAEKRDGLA